MRRVRGLALLESEPLSSFFAGRKGGYFAAIFFHLQLLRLRLECLLSLSKRGADRKRIVASACYHFPIYSHTFVYQELSQLAKAGHRLRFLYGKLMAPHEIPSVFAALWDGRRKMTYHPMVCKLARAHYLRRFPGKIRKLDQMVSDAAGISVAKLHSHPHYAHAFAYTRMVEAFGPDYLHSYFFYENTLFSLFASFLLGIPRGVSCYADHLLDDYEFKLVPLHLQQCRIVIATSNRIKEELLSIAPAADEDRILVKPNAIDTSFFAPPEESHRSRQAFRIVSVSRIEPKKGLIYLVEAVKKLRDKDIQCTAHIIGGVDGNEEGRKYAALLSRRIEELGLEDSVLLEGVMTADSIRSFFSNSHLFVAPYVETKQGDKDGIPTSLLEAMSSGMPVVATNAGSITEVIEDGRDGLLVPQRDADALASAIGRLQQLDEEREELGRRAAHKAKERFDVTACEQAFHERLSLILEDSAPWTNRVRTAARRTYSRK